MLGSYSIMDLVTLGGLVANLAVILGVFVQVVRDNHSLKRELEILSQNQKELSENQKELSQNQKELSTVLGSIIQLSNNMLNKTDLLSDKGDSIKTDTIYISDEMKLEKMARMSLYQNTSRAEEILETMDMMREVVIQNADLSRQVAKLEVQNEKLLMENRDNDTIVKRQEMLLTSIQSINSKLSEFEGYRESDEIRGLLKGVMKELSEL